MITLLCLCLRLTTLSGVLEHTVNATDLPLAVFTAPGVVVCGGSCEVIGESEATLSDSFGISWEVKSFPFECVCIY